MNTKIVPPTINKTAFNCPHCETKTTQHWFKLYSTYIEKDDDSGKTGKPWLVTQAFIDNLKKALEEREEEGGEVVALKIHLKETISYLNGLVYFEPTRDNIYSHNNVINLHLSQCYECNKIAVWRYDQLLFPSQKYAVEPNPDLPEDIQVIYNEARSIVNESHRAAAALLRLCAHKLCVRLGQKGKNFNEDIAGLVKEGLDSRLQKSLDIVRVYGNAEIHPGEIDLKEKTDTASKLFKLINIIATQMITNQKEIDGLFGDIPPEKLKKIEERDKKATKKKN